jgi:hypothetical protein
MMKEGTRKVSSLARHAQQAMGDGHMRSLYELGVLAWLWPTAAAATTATIPSIHYDATTLLY